MANSNRVIAKAFADFDGILASYEKFNAIDDTKKQRIVIAALEEFATKDYSQASTNVIVTKAGISKGLLFHYFGDKAGLFGYLQTYVVQLLVSKILEQANFEGGEVFEVLKQTTEVKLRITARYPLEVSFMVRTMKSDLPPELQGDINVMLARSFDSLAVITQNLDETLLKPELDKHKVVKLINWACVGMTNEAIAEIDSDMSIKHYTQLAKDIDDDFDFLRSLVYK